MNQFQFKKSLYHLYYGLKFFPFRKERAARQEKGRKRGFVGIQIDGLSFPHLQQAMDRRYLPNLERYLGRGHKMIEYYAGLPSTTPAAQAAIFYGDSFGIPAFRWFEKKSGQIITCNDIDHVQTFRQELFKDRQGLLEGGSSYSNILDGGAARSIFTVSTPNPHQTLFGRLGGLRIILLLMLNPWRVCRMAGATILEYIANRQDEKHSRKKRRWQTREGLFPLVRIFCNVILRELQTFGVIADVYAGVPAIYTTYSGYDELAHHFGPDSWPALRNLKYTDKRIGEIIRAVRYVPGADYQLIIMSDHGQTPGYPFQNRFGATLGDAVSGFLRKNQQATVSSGPLAFTRVQLGFIEEELKDQPGWRKQVYRQIKNYLQRKIHDLVPETLKIDQEGGVVITYSSSLAHLYITGSDYRLTWQEVDQAQPMLLRFLRKHKGIGFVLAKGEDDEICLFHANGKLVTHEGVNPPLHAKEFLHPYGEPHDLIEALRKFGKSEKCGDLVIFGALDEEGIACFDDQVGGHGSVGGDQSRPFLILPLGHPVLDKKNPSGYEFLHYEVFKPCLGPKDDQ